MAYFTIKVEHNEAAGTMTDLFNSPDRYVFMQNLKRYVGMVSSGLRPAKFSLDIGDSQATATITVATYANIEAGDVVIVGGVSLTATAGTPSTGQFKFQTSETITAGHLATAINLAANGLNDICTAVAVLGVVTLTAVEPGAMGNGIEISVSDKSVQASGTIAVDSYSDVSDGDTVTVAGTALTAKVATAEVQTLTCLAKASCAAGDYCILTDAAGAEWAIAIDTNGSDPAPTGARWTAIAAGNKGQADITSDTSAANVCATVKAAFNALTGFTAVCTLDDAAGDGTMTATMAATGACANPAPFEDDDAGAGVSIIGVETTPGWKLANATSVQFEKVTDANTVAANIAALITAHTTLNTYVTATAALAVVTVTAVNPGATGNSVTLATSDATAFVLSGSKLTGGVTANTAFTLSGAHLASGSDGTEASWGFGIA